jgi:hypothetical protein
VPGNDRIKSSCEAFISNQAAFGKSKYFLLKQKNSRDPDDSYESKTVYGKNNGDVLLTFCKILHQVYQQRNGADRIEPVKSVEQQVYHSLRSPFR